MVEIVPVETINPAPIASNQTAVQAFKATETRGKGNSPNYSVSVSKVTLGNRICRAMRNNVGWVMFISMILLTAIISVMIGVLSKLGN